MWISLFHLCYISIFLESDKLLADLSNYIITGFHLETLEYYPWGTGYFFNRKRFEDYDKLQDYLVIIMEAFIEEHITTFKETDIRDVLDAYLKEDAVATFGRRKLANTLLILLPDTAATSVFMALWLFVFLLNFPEYETKILEEIREIKKGESHISMNDRPNMPVTESFIMEVFRMADPSEVGIPTKPLKDTEFRGYNIPSYVSIIPNYGAVHKDPKVFPDPLEFKPERFIGDEGKIKNIEGFLPFGLGKTYIKLV